MQKNNHVLAAIKPMLANPPGVYQVVLNWTGIQDVFQLGQGVSPLPAVYFSFPNQTKEFLAVGAWRILDAQSVDGLLASSRDSIRLFGVQSFESKSNLLPSHFWVLPIVWFEKTADGMTQHIIVDSISHSESDIIHQINQVMLLLNDPAHQSSQMNTPMVYQNKVHATLRDDWLEQVERAQRYMQQTSLKKVVLARQTHFEFKHKVSPFKMIQQLQSEDPGVYHFCVSYGLDQAFIGGTPERLFEIKNNHIFTDALAGTIVKSSSVQMPNTLVSKKLINEHQYVVDYIQDALNQLCSSVHVDHDRQLIDLKCLIHLLIRFKGELNHGVTWLTVLNALHPTPAVAGVPTVLAKQCIQQLESFDRGWYAGPMGMVSRDESVIVVAIRSGLIHQNKVTLTAGAGIISESKPEDEWHELNGKISLFNRLFKGDL